ncbi:hypothetical protein [Micromonospora sp. NPDC048898]|uniref:hypothetical protein n=1 Tax=Micromonospora sp. NPDC048898 TaxID=3364260 RepID=UPI00371DCD86
MNDEEAGRLLERLADGVPVRPAPVDHLLRAARSAQRRTRNVRLFGVAAAITLALGGSVLATEVVGERTTSGNDSANGGSLTAPSPSPATDRDNPTKDRSGPLPDGGAASCTERSTPEAIAGRAFAFDGVVVNIGPAQSNRSGIGKLDLVGVTFAVVEWFSGGTAANVAVDMAPPMTGTHDPTAETFSSYAIGSRLLVSGEPRQGGSALDNAIAWGCGFTRYYDQPAAQSWRQAATAQRALTPASTPTRRTSVR